MSILDYENDVRRLDLTIQQYCVNLMLEDELFLGFATRPLGVRSQWLVETAMRALRISYKYPAKVLQRDREIARYPATLWSHFLHAIRLSRFAKYKRVLLNEHLAFPGVEIPSELKTGAYVCYDYRTVQA